MSDEIKNNSVRGIYNAKKAHFKAYQKRWRAKLQCMKVAMDPVLKRFVIDSMTYEDQSPQGISGRLKHVERTIQYASAKAIYNFVWSPGGRQIERHLYSRAVHKKPGRKRDTSVTIDGRTMIDKNKAIRRYVKKKSDLSLYSKEFIAEVERKLRVRFMECLNYKTPREAFTEELQKQKTPLNGGMMGEKLLVENLN